MSATSISFVMMVFAFVAGLAAAILWESSNSTWRAHLDEGFNAGVALYGIVSELRSDPDGVVPQSDFDLKVVRPKSQLRNGVEQINFDVPQRAVYETSFSLRSGAEDSPASQDRLAVRIFSPNIKYQIAGVQTPEATGLAYQFGEISREIARICSDATLFVALDETRWLRAQAPHVWACTARPADYRLLALLLGTLVMGILFSVANGFSLMLDRLAQQIFRAARRGLLEPIPARGVAEVRRLTAAVNEFFKNEHERLEQRALLMSGISHDLGTPATRLKLRTALIEDAALREKLDRDIDQMTDMIDGVLSYTRHEMDQESPKRISMRSLVEALVDDYQDIGHPVTFFAPDLVNLDRPGSVFSQTSEGTKMLLRDQQRVLSRCRPNALRRALTNLIDNAIKYGEKAEVHLSANADQVTIQVVDHGSHASFEAPEKLVEPFVRGDNAKLTKGAGLGLTIANSVVRGHGGELQFEQLADGMRVTMILPRWL
ncbi:sensor histidine kinase [Maritalea mediterranea]|uniref:histidine kinase n=1 Tax=Maritalea mediterranea TaxID=2909667 RepID=A0ABS9E8J6_9HYPH|nr:ATP-binding protein [Maritalea mediterranea]MCF4099199.1 ATP-binding protein [Maritalea mediterranea]